MIKPNDIRFIRLLQQWLQGDLRRREESELHRLAEQDDFRREALEGFLNTAAEDHEARLQSMHEKLALRTAGRRSRPLWPRLLALAAALVLIGAAIRFLPDWVGRDRAPVALQAEKSDSAQSPAQTQTPRIPSDAVPEKSQESQTASAPEPARRRAAAPERPMPSQPEPIALAEPESPPAEMEAAETAPAYDAVVEMKRAAPPPAAAARAQEETAAASQSQPVGGWDAFNRFLVDNARLTPAARNNNVSGFVRLSFAVDSSGAPENIRVVQPLGYGLDAEAVRLLRQTRWTPSGMRDTVDIWFRR